MSKTKMTTTLDAPTRRKYKPYPKYKDSRVEWLGEIPAHWELWKLAHAFNQIGSGTTPKTDDRDYYDGDVPWVTTSELREKIIEDTTSKLSTSALKDHPTLRLYPEGTLLMAMYGATIGRLGILGIEACTNQACIALARPTILSTLFTYYWLLAFRNIIINLSSGGGQPNINQEKVAAIRIPCPPLAEQQAIAEFLDSETAKIDALIEKKRRLIELLEEKRSALISHSVTKGLDPNSPMKDSGVEWLGEIPMHWEVDQLRRVVIRFVDYRGRTPEKVPAGIPLITARNIKNNRIDFSESEEFIREEDYDSWMIRGFPAKGDVLVTTEAPLGEIAQINETYVALAQRIILLKSDPTRITNDYLKYFLSSSSGRTEFWTRATGSTAIGIKASHFKSILVVVPSLPEQASIAEYLDRETAKIDTLKKKDLEAIDKLREYRTALISAAVTGKIDVRGD